MCRTDCAGRIAQDGLVPDGRVEPIAGGTHSPLSGIGERRNGETDLDVKRRNGERDLDVERRNGKLH